MKILYEMQSNLRLRPPLLSDQFSKIPNVSKSDHYVWNLLQAIAITFILELKFKIFLCF